MGSPRRWVRGVALAAVLVVVAAACSKSSDSTSSSPASPSGAAIANSATGAQTSTGAGSIGAVDQPADRKQIRTGKMTLAVARTDDVATVADDAVRAATDAGGRVDGDHRTGGDAPIVELVLRVPPDELDGAVARIRTLAEVPESTIDTEDVSERYTDLEGRIQALETSTARLRGFLAEATDANQIAYLENELTRREADLEAMKGQLRALSAKTDLATLTVSVRTKAAAPVVDQTSAPAPLEALANGWKVFAATVSWIVAVLLSVLPFLVVALVAAAGARWWVRRRKPRAPAEAPAPSMR